MNDFGGLNQYDGFLRLAYPRFGGFGTTVTRINNFRQILSNNPCTP